MLSPNNINQTGEVISSISNAVHTSKLDNNPSQKEVEDEAKEINAQMERIQVLMSEIDSIPDNNMRDLMQDCMREILQFHGTGLAKMLEHISSVNDSARDEIKRKLLDDKFINGLLLIHDIHPLDLMERLIIALDKVKPYMDSHGGNVEIVAIEDGVAKLKLVGSCDGCPSSAMTLEVAIKESIEEYCPDITGIEVEGLTDNTRRINSSDDQSQKNDWKIIHGMEQMSNGQIRSYENNGVEFIICKTSDKLFAYRNNCPACEMPLASGTIEERQIRCKLGHAYDLFNAGICVDNDELRIEPFPLLGENGTVRVAVK